MWTGAVGSRLPSGSPPSGWPSEVLEETLRSRDPLGSTPGALDLCLLAAAEWEEPLARLAGDRLSAEASALIERGRAPALRQENADSLAESSETARILLQSHAVLGAPPCLEEGLRLAGEISSAVERADAGDAPLSRAALALLCAAPFAPNAGLRPSARRALDRITQAPPGPSADHGSSAVLEGNAWAIMALTESFLATGFKPHREAADARLRFLFQEFWDRERGGFLDGGSSPEANALALEGAWRLSHLKGNIHYAQWVQWGINGLWSSAPGRSRARLARVWDMLGRGRMDFELVAAPGGGGPLLEALGRHYMPRKIISFIEPDDQDFLLAHRLPPGGKARLFACLDLKPLSHADEPAQVQSLVKVLK